MKIAVITYHRVYNYGAALQAYATVKCIEKIGHKTEIIDYIPEKVRNYGSFHQTFYETRLFHKNVIKCILIAIMKIPGYKKKAKAFNDFIDRYFPLTCPYYSEKELMKNQPQADVYCTGSDQVWNNTYLPFFDFVYFLSFIESRNKIAFSASFGRNNFSSNELAQIIPYLSKYKAISVREKSGLDMLKTLDNIKKEAIIDPTLVLDQSEWDKIAEKNISYDSYILVYQLHGDSKVEDAANKIAKQMGKKTIRIMSDEFKKSKCDILAKYPSVPEFIALIANADLIVTDSFHGTVFSINFNRNFIVRVPESTGERIKSVLEMMGLTERIATTDNEAVEIAQTMIDFTHCNHRLEFERKKAMRFLKEAIDLCSEE